MAVRRRRGNRTIKINNVLSTHGGNLMSKRAPKDFITCGNAERVQRDRAGPSAASNFDLWPFIFGTEKSSEWN